MIKDPKGILLGKGNMYRYVQLSDLKTLSKAAIRKMVEQSHSLVLSKIDPTDELIKGKSILRSVSEKERVSGPVKRSVKKSVVKKAKM